MIKTRIISDCHLNDLEDHSEVLKSPNVHCLHIQTIFKGLSLTFPLIDKIVFVK